MPTDYRMVMTRTPLRITFTGGGTDLPDYYVPYGPGAVVSAAINRYIFVTVSKNFYKDRIRLGYAKVENDVASVDEIQHQGVKAALKYLDITKGVQITSIAEVPAGGTGLGSSSTFMVGLLHALHTWLGEERTEKQLADEAIHIEREVLKESGGKQDQYMAALGGIQLMEFGKDGGVKTKPVKLKEQELRLLKDHLLLLFTGVQRSAAKVLSTQSKEVKDHLDEYNKMRDIAYKTYASLSKMDIKEVGKQLHENWLLKRQLSGGISGEKIDDWYDKAMKAGALGGKLIGAGGGGFMLFLASPDKHDWIKKALPELSEEKFHFEMQGSKVLYAGE